MINQRRLIKQYCDDNIIKFNEQLFTRTTDKIVEELKKVILSCQREYGFILRVISFTVIDDVEQVYDTLYTYEEMREFRNSRKKDKQIKPKIKKDNPYNFINIKDTDMILLIVKYYIEVKGEAEYVDVPIAIPRVVKDYYFRINGNYYCAQYQIMDTTYNNATSSNTAALPKVTIRTVFMPIRIYKKSQIINTYYKEEVHITYFIAKIFSKMVGVCKYMLAKFGLYTTIDLMGFGRFIVITDKPLEQNAGYYVFNKYNIFINVNKMAYDADETLQTLVFNLYMSIHKDTEFIDFFSNNYWLRSLGKEFGVDNEEKGIQVLVSLEGIYDIKTKEVLRISEEDKQSIYHLLIWTMREFQQLMAKDNLNLALKRIKEPAEYIASLYAAKISTGLYRISNSQRSRLTVNKVKKVVCTLPMFLISAISKCNLINYRDLVHDLDSMAVLSYTFNEITGLGNETMQSVPEAMRQVDISHTDRLDLDSSKKSNPGITGALLPTVKLYNNGYFSDFQEPNTWHNNFNEVIDNYKKTEGLKEGLIFEEQILGKNNEQAMKEVEEDLLIQRNLMRPIYAIETAASIVDITYAMEFSGLITVDKGDDNNED